MPLYSREDYRFVVRYMCLPYALVSAGSEQASHE